MKVTIFLDNNLKLDYNFTYAEIRTITIGQLKLKIFKDAKDRSGLTLRLIHRGQVLTDDSKALWHFYKLTYRSSNSSSFNTNEEPAITFHASFSSSNTNNPSLLETSPSTGGPTRLRAVGFDRLLEAGFNENDIQELRRNFHRNRNRNADREMENMEAGINVATQLDQDREAEELWMDEMVNARESIGSLFNTNGANNQQQMMQGQDDEDPYFEWAISLLIGFFSGVLVFLILQLKLFNFSQRRLAGIFVGFSMNVLFAIFLRWLG